MNRGGISAGEGEPFVPPPSPGAHQPTRDSPLASCEEGTCSGATKLRLSSECQRVFGEQGRGVPGSLWANTDKCEQRGGQSAVESTLCARTRLLKFPHRLGVGGGTLGDTGAV